MKSIRIGNDIIVRWFIYKNGQPADLAAVARHISVILSCRGEERRINDYVIDGNCITFTFYGRDQKKSGAYRLTYVENEGLENMHTVDSCDAFILVDSSQKSGGSCSCGNTQVDSVEMNSYLIAPSDGLSAYDIALRNGFSGTVVEWLESLRGPQGPAGPQGEPFSPELASEEEIEELLNLEVPNDGGVTTIATEEEIVELFNE